jgi:uncharacterized protein DUF4388
MRAKVTIGAEGEIVLPPGVGEALGLRGGTEVDLVGVRNAFGLLTPARDDAPRAYFAGSLAALTVPEVVQFVFTSLKSGVLLLAFGDDADRAASADGPERLRRKSIYFRDGQVVFASSSDRADRLGAVLGGAGIVSPADLERCGRLVRSGRPLGKVLVDEGVLSPGQLYAGIGLQVREILLGAFVETEGTFAFLEGPHDERNAVKLPERTRELLLAGMKRVEEAEGLALQLGGRAAVLCRGDGAPRPPLPPAEARLLELADGRRTITRAAAEGEIPLLAALRAAVALVADGVLRVEPAGAAPPVADEVVIEVEVEVDVPALAAQPPHRGSGPFETYRRIFKHVYAAFVAAEPDARARLNSYFDRLPPKQRGVFEGVTVGEDGEMDVAQILVNVSSTGAYKGAAVRARSLEALEALLAFALFEVKNCLPKAEAEVLLREVGRMQVGKA